MRFLHCNYFRRLTSLLNTCTLPCPNHSCHIICAGAHVVHANSNVLSRPSPQRCEVHARLRRLPC